MDKVHYESWMRQLARNARNIATCEDQHTTNDTVYFSNVSTPNDHAIASAILTIRSVCKARDCKCEGCPLSIFDPSDKTYECGVTYNDPMCWDISAPPAKPWKAFKQIGE